MSYFPDLSPYAYGHRKHPGVVHVGWLDGIHEYNKGAVAARFIDYLNELATEPVELYRGFHVCEICSRPKGLLTHEEQYAWMRGRSSNGEIRVTRGNITYAAPVLIMHYIQEHGYLPPQEFLDTVEEMCRVPPLRIRLLEVKICRTESWLDSQSNPIPIGEWRKVVESHPQLEPRDVAFARNPANGDRIVVPLGDGAVMHLGGDSLFFAYEAGRIGVGCPEEAFPVLREIAHSLGAKLQSEDGEPL